MSEFAAIFRAICLLTLLGASSVKFRKRIEVPIGFTTGKRAENAIGINSRIGQYPCVQDMKAQTIIGVSGFKGLISTVAINKFNTYNFW